VHFFFRNMTFQKLLLDLSLSENSHSHDGAHEATQPNPKRASPRNHPNVTRAATPIYPLAVTCAMKSSCLKTPL
jgi:hypothetical protein